MKKCMVIFVLVFMAAGLVYPQGCVPPPAGIVSWWPGQDNANDVIGGNNGLLVGAGGYTNGEVGQAFTFNGSGEMVTVGNATNLQLQNFTIEAWIKRASVSVVSYGTAGNGIIFGFGYAGYGLYLDSQGVPALSRIDLDQTKTTVAITDTNFHHLAVTKSGSTVVFYIDGIAYSAPAYNPTFGFTTVAAIGGRGDTLGNTFLGVIDEVSVYNRALASNEVTAIYLAGSAGKCQESLLTPTITTQPTNLTVVVSNPAVFTVAAAGTPPLSYQWSFNQTNVVGATNATLTLPAVQAAQAGNYSVVVSNQAGSVTSAVAVLSVSVPLPPSCDPPPAGIVGWWPGQGNANDIIGGDNGSLSSSGATYASGKVGLGFRLDGTNGYVQIPDSAALKPTNVTVEAWVWLDPNVKTTAGEYIIFKQNSQSSYFEGYSLLKISLANGDGTYTDRFEFVASSGDDQVTTFSTTAVQRGVWYHVAGTYDGNELTLYVNGVAEASAVAGFALDYGTEPVFFGTSGTPEPYTCYLAGIIDEPSIYSRALASNEVAAIYNAGSAGKCQGTPLAPTIITQPTNLTVMVSNPAVFAVAAQGTAPLSYQWSFNHTNLVGATNATLTLPAVQAGQAGNYWVVVSNEAGWVTSAVAVLNVLLPPPSCAPPPSGIVSWWPGQGNASDIIGGNNGTIVGAAGYTNGEVGQAFVFDGTQEMVTVGNATNLQLQNFTIEAWVKRNSPSVVSYGTAGNGIIFGFGFDGYGLYLDAQGVPTLSRIGIDQTKPATGITDTNFHHVAVTKSGSTVVFYIDGVAFLAPAYNPLFTFATVAAIGGRGDNLDNSFLGVIDEVSVYNRALGSNEIAAIYLAGSAGKCFTPTPPTITTQPTNLTVVVSNPAVFTVVAAGTPPLSYQWSFNHTNVVGATNATLTLPAVQAGQAGNYSVVVSNEAGWATSAVAVLNVLLPPPSCDPPPSGIVSWWPGQGNTSDIIGGNNGTIVGAAGYTNGEVGQAFVFDGTQEMVTVGNATNLQLQNFTIEAWVKRNSPSVVSYGTAGNGIIFGFGFDGYGLYLDPQGLPALSRIGLDETKPATGITDTNFHHLAVTKSGSTVIFYIDGVASLAPAYNPLFTFATVAAIGGRGDNLDNSFLGVIDEVSVYNRALGSNEIAAIYLAGSAGKCFTPTPPTITTQPTNLTVVVSNPAVFTVVAAGTPPLSYQWSFNHTNVVGATNATLTLPAVQAGQAGNYWVVVSNEAGSVTSAVVVLNVLLPPPSCAPPPSGIVSWWPGQGNASDIIGTNNGAVEGGLGFAPGEVGQAFLFNATNEDVKIPASASLNVGAGNGFTLEAWVNCSNVVALNPIFEWNVGNGVTYWGVHFYVGAAGPGSLYANVVDSAGAWHPISSAEGIVASNTFEHVALTYDKTSGTATLYCNGTIVAQSNLGSITPQTTYNLYLGRRVGPDAYLTFAGLIDEPSIYNRALASNEVAAIYQAGSAGKCFTPETTVTMIATNAMSGNMIVMPVLMNAVGVENTFLASVGYDPTKLVLRNVQLGQATAGAYLEEVDKMTNSGLVGFAIMLNSGTTLPAGTNEQVALLNFLALPVTSNTTVSLFFTNSPTLQQTYDNNFDLLPTIYSGGVVTLLPAEYEADVYPRTNGDHYVTVPDWLEEGRMVAGLDKPATPDEFHRADCAPRNAPDGVLTVADWVQAGRYALGLDPLTLVTLPPAPILKFQPLDGTVPTRTLLVGNVAAQRGQTVSVPVELVCTTNENAVGLTVSFDPNQVQITGITLGSAMAAARTNINSTQPGKLGIVMALPPGAALNAGTNLLLVLQLTVSANVSGLVPLTLDNSVVTLQVADNTANALAANYVSGSVTLPPQPTLAGAISGPGGLQLTWPISTGTFSVQSANNPLGPWSNAPLSITTNGGTATVMVTVTNQQQYFRLVGQ